MGGHSGLSWEAGLDNLEGSLLFSAILFLLTSCFHVHNVYQQRSINLCDCGSVFIQVCKTSCNMFEGLGFFNV